MHTTLGVTTTTLLASRVEPRVGRDLLEDDAAAGGARRAAARAFGGSYSRGWFDLSVISVDKT